MNEHVHDAALRPDLALAPKWALLTGDLGRFAVIAAGVLFLLALVAALVPRASSARATRILFGLGALGLVVATGSLATLFLRDQFSFQYVFNHSDARNPIQYKISAIWTAQEGSFLLWGLLSAVFGFWALLRAGEFTRAAGATMALFLAGICGILWRETPFNLLSDVREGANILLPPNGNGMTPSLQNYWVAIHPPTIFSGFGLLIVPFALAVAGVVRRDLTGWIAVARPFALWGVAVLGLGISMGGLWAYETQGWGGFWAWDPVENVSLVPWLFLLGLAHALLIQARTRRGLLSAFLLGGLPFLAFVYGTFLTRSGLLSEAEVSVHSFASMDRSALVILRGMLIVLALGYVAFAIQAARLVKVAPLPAPAERPAGYDRGQAYAAGIVLLSLIAIVAAVGMSWPVIRMVQGRTPERVEEFVYHKALIWFFIPLLLLMAVGPFMNWRAEPARETWRRVMNAFSISLGLLGLSIFAMKIPGSGIVLDATRRVEGPLGTSWPQLAVIGFLLWLCLFAVVANVARMIGGVKRSKMTLGGFVSHAGIAVLLGGLLLSHGLERKDRLFPRPGIPAEGLGYRFEFVGFSAENIDDRENKARFRVTEPNGHVFEARPGLYNFEGPEGKPTWMKWPHIERAFTHDVYVALHDPIVEVFEEPMNLKVGETKTQNGVTLTYLQPTMVGQPGQPGTKFGAIIRMTQGGKTVTTNPELMLTEDGLRPSIVPAGTEFRMAMVAMNAADRSVSVQPLFSPPAYPIEVFEKPMTSLVWLGTGIFTIGGAMSAFARRLRRPAGPLMPSSGTGAPEPEVPEGGLEPLSLDDRPTPERAPLTTA